MYRKKSPALKKQQLRRFLRMALLGSHSRQVSKRMSLTQCVFRWPRLWELMTKPPKPQNPPELRSFNISPTRLTRKSKPPPKLVSQQNRLDWLHGASPAGVSTCHTWAVKRHSFLYILQRKCMIHGAKNEWSEPSVLGECQPRTDRPIAWYPEQILAISPRSPKKGPTAAEKSTHPRWPAKSTTDML